MGQVERFNQVTLEPALGTAIEHFEDFVCGGAANSLPTEEMRKPLALRAVILCRRHIFHRGSRLCGHGRNVDALGDSRLCRSSTPMRKGFITFSF